MASETEDGSVASLWEDAKYLLRWLVAVCGSPRTLIAEVWLSPKERREIRFWLRPVEELVRRLLVVEAARLLRTMRVVKPPRGKPPGRPAARSSVRRSGFQDPDDSTAWRVRFSLFGPAASRPVQAGVPEHLLPRLHDLDTGSGVLAPERLALDAARHRERSETQHEAGMCPQGWAAAPERSRGAGNPWSMARRIEAVKRVLDNPAPYARRLARLMKHNAERLVRACRPPPPPEPGQRPHYGDGPLRMASGHALEALSVFDTS